LIGFDFKTGFYFKEGLNMTKPAFILHPLSTSYAFNPDHPFDPIRLHLSIDLLVRSNALERSHIISPELATKDQLTLVHLPAFVDAVELLSKESIITDEAKLEQYGLHTEDTPHFLNMHDIASAVVGGTLHAVEMVMRGETEHAMHMAGGLHHAMKEKASGFCIYNDAAVAIAHAKQKYNARVLYIDTDVHHGDGVQWIFYDDPDVCTFSIHETGKYLYPGTGFVYERGDGDGFGTSINIPVEPYTEDDSWMACFEQGLRRVIAQFKPDLIVSQHGCDAHILDPLSHTACSMDIFAAMPKLIHQLAHEYCEGRWVALGGGGYDWWRVVPRAWSLVWLEMIDHPIVQAIAKDGNAPVAEDWLAYWQGQAPVQLEKTWLDHKSAWAPMPRREEITNKNRETLHNAMQYT
jgi:acetoin utilization protein AcuC